VIVNGMVVWVQTEG